MSLSSNGLIPKQSADYCATLVCLTSCSPALPPCYVSNHSLMFAIFAISWNKLVFRRSIFVCLLSGTAGDEVNSQITFARYKKSFIHTHTHTNPSQFCWPLIFNCVNIVLHIVESSRRVYSFQNRCLDTVFSSVSFLSQRWCQQWNRFVEA